MFRSYLFIFCVSILLLNSCVGDDILQDFVEPEIRITSQIDTLEVGSQFTYDVLYFNNIGQRETVDLVWSSSDESIVTVNSEGTATGIAEGDASITASFESDGIITESSVDVAVGSVILPPPPPSEMLRSKEGTLMTTTFYELRGDFTFEEELNGVTIDIQENYVADDRLPGLYIYLSNNRNSIADALEIGPVEQFSGAHSYTVEDVGYEDFSFVVYFCKPFNVKVGEAEL